MNNDAFEPFDKCVVSNPNKTNETIIHGFTVYPDDQSMIDWASEALRTGEFDFEVAGGEVELINVAVIKSPHAPKRNIARLTFMSWN